MYKVGFVQADGKLSVSKMGTGAKNQGEQEAIEHN